VIWSADFYAQEHGNTISTNISGIQPALEISFRQKYLRQSGFTTHIVSRDGSIPEEVILHGEILQKLAKNTQQTQVYISFSN